MGRSSAYRSLENISLFAPTASKLIWYYFYEESQEVIDDKASTGDKPSLNFYFGNIRMFGRGR
jgi:hypothetical protein